jgi:hypothetical protein
VRSIILGLALPLVCSAAASAADRPPTFTRDIMPSTFVGVIFMDDAEFKRQVDERTQRANQKSSDNNQQ